MTKGEDKPHIHIGLKTPDRILDKLDLDSNLH